MIDFETSDVTASGVLFLEDTMSKGMRTEDEVRDSAKLVLGFDKTEDGVQQGTGQKPEGSREGDFLQENLLGFD